MILGVFYFLSLGRSTKGKARKRDLGACLRALDQNEENVIDSRALSAIKLFSAIDGARTRRDPAGVLGDAKSPEKSIAVANPSARPCDGNFGLAFSDLFLSFGRKLSARDIQAFRSRLNRSTSSRLGLPRRRRSPLCYDRTSGIYFTVL